MSVTCYADVFNYRILPIKCTVQVEVGNFLWSRDVGNLRFTAHLNDCWSESIGRYCSFALSLFSIVRSCGEYEQLEREGTAEIAQFSAGLQTRQEERYVISLFLLLLGGSFTSFSWHLVIPPLTMKNRPCALIWTCALNRKNTVYRFNTLHILMGLWSKA